VTCPDCGGTGSIRQAFPCPVCGGRYHVPRNPPIRVRCPHCSSLLWTDWQTVQILERRTIPIPAPGSRAPLGAIGGGLLGLALGGPLGGLIGFLIGGAAGVAAEAVIEAREE
jgi:hypothetical protein